MRPFIWLDRTGACKQAIARSVELLNLNWFTYRANFYNWTSVVRDDLSFVHRALIGTRKEQGEQTLRSNERDGELRSKLRFCNNARGGAERQHCTGKRWGREIRTGLDKISSFARAKYIIFLMQIEFLSLEHLLEHQVVPLWRTEICCYQTMCSTR